MHHYQNKRDTPGDFFPMPKAAFRLGLDSGEIAVLAFLMYCEDRKTYQCHPTMLPTTLPVIAIYPFLQKYFVQGVMIGAVKG